MKQKSSDYFMRFSSVGTALDTYKEAGGYEALSHALHMKREAVIDEIENSGLLGRGGAGFLTGKKWRSVSGQKNVFIVCNADEGEPGTFKDRFLMLNAPYLLIEGITIAGYATGATKGYIYIRGEYPESFETMKHAIAQAEADGLLGNSIADDFSFSIDIKLGGGSYVVGDETALLHSLMGYRGTPWNKPPYPTQKGLWDCPTVINNVETLSCVPLILSRGASWFASIGNAASPGPKLYCVSGRVQKPGVYEFPMGVPLRELIDAAGGVDGDFKAVQIGGTAGPVYRGEALDYRLDYASMKEAGGALGSGAVVVMNTSVSMAEVLEVEMRFFAEESCGKCFPCRYGTRQLSFMADNIATGNGREEYLDHMLETASIMKASSFCPFGKSVEMPVSTIINAFGGELLSHIRQHNFVKEEAI
ncbi:MAG: complex I 51 kDa subunit family protein [Spirochaetota bacterium]